MKKILKFLLPLFLLGCLNVQSQTVTEISNILNTKPQSITTSSASSLNADLIASLDLNTLGYRVIGIDIGGTWVGTITFQGSNDNFSTYTNSIAAYLPGVVGFAWTLTTITPGHYNIPTLGFRYIRVRMTAYTSGTATASAYGYLNNTDFPTNSAIYLAGTSIVSISGTVPVSGPLTDAQLRASPVPVSGTFWQATQPVSGTFWQATQPVSGTVTANIGTTNGLVLDATLAKLTITPGTALGSNTIAMMGGSVTTSAPTYTNGNINPLTLTLAGRLRVDGSGVTQPVSGTVDIGTTGGLALDATLTNKTQFAKITDGTNDASVKAASTAAIATDKAFVVAISPNNTVGVTGTFWQATQPVSGTFWQATQPVSGTVTANAGTNLNTSLLALEAGGNLATVKTNTDNLSLSIGSTTSGQKGNLIQGAVTTSAPSYTTAQTNPLSLTTVGNLRVDGSTVTQPVSGTFWQATQPVSGTFWQATQPVSGTFWQATQPVSGTITANIGTSGSLALDATLAKLTIAQNAALGSNTLAMMGGSVTTAAPSYTTGNVSALSLTTAGLLRVDNSGVTQPVSGTITANAGTNLNTSLLALEAGGNLATIKTNTDNLALAQASTTSGQKGNLIQGAVTTAAPTYTTAQSNPLSLNTAGGLRTEVATALPTGTNYIGYTNADLSANTVTITTPGNGNSFALSGMQSASLNITGTAATFVFKAQISTDAGTTWTDTYLDLPNGNKVATAAANGQYTVVLPGGTSHIRVVLNSIVSGNFIYSYRASNVMDPSLLASGQPNSVKPPVVIGIGASDGTNLQELSTNVKGTQGATGLSVQEIKDAGRVHLMFSANAVASGTTGTETAITLTKSSGTSATSAAASFVVTSGKRFRITSITVGSRGNASATIQITTFNLRINTGGAVITSSTPIVFAMTTATPATASAWDRFQLPIPDGYEILGDGTLQFGITANSVFTTNAPTWYVNITGYEY